MHFSVPLFGLTHCVTVVRKTDTDDGFGGIVPGARTVLYAEWDCRITALQIDNQAEMAFAGQDAAKTFKCTGTPAPQIALNDFIEVPFGQFPNTVGVLGAGDYFPEEFTVDGVTLTWDYDLGYYVDDPDTETNTFKYDTDGWLFTGDAGSYKFVLDEDCSPFYVWDRWEGGPDEPTLGPIQTFRVIWVKQQITETGTHHHTLMFIELEDSHGEDAEPDA